MLLTQIDALNVFALEHELANAGEILEGRRADIGVARCARPDCGLSQIDALGRYAAINHGSDASVAQGHGFHPARGRTCEPQLRFLLRLIGH